MCANGFQVLLLLRVYAPETLKSEVDAKKHFQLVAAKEKVVNATESDKNDAKAKKVEAKIMKNNTS